MKPLEHIPIARTAFLERKKNAFLVAVYEERYKEAADIYSDILAFARTLEEPDENTLKLFTQIRVAFKRFKSRLLENDPGRLRQDNRHLRHLLSLWFRQKGKTPDRIDFDTWQTRTQLQGITLDLVFKTAMTFQLTSGCSHYCRRCNEWALPGIRSHFSLEAVKTILGNMAEQGNPEISLYGASDPLDWADGRHDISDIVEYINTLPLTYSLLTKVPRGRIDLLKRLVTARANLSVSVTARNKSRVNSAQKEVASPIYQQHDLDDLLIPAGYDEDFITVKPSITDGYGTEITPDGAFIIIPTFTSALHPFGHQKIPVTPETKFFPVKKTGREALLIDYFKPLEGYDKNGFPCRLPGLLDVQIESIILDSGAMELTPPGMRSIDEYLCVFDEPARLKRKKMTLSVMRHLKQEFLSRTRYIALDPADRRIYQKKIKRHLMLCQKKYCLEAKRFTVSFFLDAIAAYRKKNPEKARLMRFLLKNEIAAPKKNSGAENDSSSLETLFAAPGTTAFKRFRSLVFDLLDRTNEGCIRNFIQNHPAAYDPVADVFVKKRIYPD